MSWLEQTNQRIQSFVDRLRTDKIFRRFAIFITIIIILVVVLLVRQTGETMDTRPGDAGSDTGFLPLPESRWEGSIDDLPADAELESVAGPEAQTDEAAWVQYTAPSDGLQMTLPTTPVRTEQAIPEMEGSWTAGGVAFVSQDDNGDLYTIFYQYLTDAAPESDSAEFFQPGEDGIDDDVSVSRLNVDGYQAIQTDELDPDSGTFTRSRTIVLPDRIVTISGSSMTGQVPVNFDFVAQSVVLTI